MLCDVKDFARVKGRLGPSRRVRPPDRTAIAPVAPRLRRIGDGRKGEDAHRTPCGLAAGHRKRIPRIPFIRKTLLRTERRRRRGRTARRSPPVAATSVVRLQKGAERTSPSNSWRRQFQTGAAVKDAPFRRAADGGRRRRSLTAAPVWKKRLGKSSTARPVLRRQIGKDGRVGVIP